MVESTEALIEAAREAGLELDPTGARLDESGLDFLALHARDRDGTAWVVRRPRRPDVVEAAARESRTLARVAPRLPVQVPDWQVHTGSLVAYPRLPGEPVAEMDVANSRYNWRFDLQSPPEVFVHSLAAAVAALHQIDAGAAGFEERSIQAVRRQMAQDMEIARDLAEIPPRVWAEWQAWVGEDSFWPAHTVLAHGDLHPGHILVDEDFRVTGLLDWTEAGSSDPAVDFTILNAAMGEEILRLLIRAYEEAGGRVWPRMAEHVRGRWRAYPVASLLFAARAESDVALQFARASLSALDHELAGG